MNAWCSARESSGDAGQRLLEIREQVRRVLDADRQAEQVGGS
jgi:hypothetical protein